MNILSRQYLRIFKNTSSYSNLLCGLERQYCFKSAYSLDKLYPKSNLQLFTPQFVSDKPEDKFSGYIPVEKLHITYSTSSGPGGQNVNRVNTKVDLRFKVNEATWIPEKVKEMFIEQNKTRINKEGYFVIKSEITRSQQLNLADAIEKLRSLIRKAEASEKVPISEETEEMLRKQHMKASRQRLLVKREKSFIKQGRASVKPSDIL